MLEDTRVGDLARLVADSPVAPGGGTVAAVTVALSAGLVVKAARAAGGDWADAGGTAAQATLLSRRALAAGSTSGQMFTEAVALLQSATGSGEQDIDLGDALARAAEVSLTIVGIAADVAALAAEMAEHGGITLRPECVTACVLAEAGCVAAAHLVEINLGLVAGDARLARCTAELAQARSARDRVATTIATA